MEKESSPVRPRRGVRGKKAITREEVVDGAMELLADGSSEDVSMHRLARHLGVGVMTLYSYVKNRDELLDLVVERTEADFAHLLALPGEGDWQDQLVHHFCEWRRLGLAHPGLALTILHSGQTLTSASRESGKRIMDEVIGLMRKAGLSADTSAYLYLALHQYTSGALLREIVRGRRGPQDPRLIRWQGTLRSLRAKEYPHLRAARSVFLANDAEAQFIFGLRAILHGATAASSELPPGSESTPAFVAVPTTTSRASARRGQGG